MKTYSIENLEIASDATREFLRELDETGVTELKDKDHVKRVFDLINGLMDEYEEDGKHWFEYKEIVQDFDGAMNDLMEYLK